MNIYNRQHPKVKHRIGVMKKPYNDLNSYFKSLYGHRVHKISVDAGLSCPNRDGTLSTKGCIYCNARGSGTGAHAKGISIYDQINNCRERVAKRFKAKKFIAYFQAFTNTYAPVAKLKTLYDEALSVKGVTGLAIGTRPDCVDEAVIDLLSEYAKKYLVWVEYGMQSAHDPTLDIINRGHDVACLRNAIELTKDKGIHICVHVILGLPGESREEMLETADKIAGMGIDGIKLHLLYVIKGTALETLYNEGKYRCMEQEAYAETVCDFIERLPDNMIIQRLTGDPHPYELVAPKWALEKKQTLEMIHAIFKKRNSFQGMKAKTKTGAF